MSTDKDVTRFVLDNGTIIETASAQSLEEQHTVRYDVPPDESNRNIPVTYDKFPYRAVILDLDGTLVETKSGDTFRQTPEDWKFIDSAYDDPLGPRVRYLRDLKKQGVKLAIATNQGGVAVYSKRLPEERMKAQINVTAQIVGVHFVAWSFEHPSDRDAMMRKPKPGMLLAALQAFGSMERKHAIMVGDRLEDREAARNAGIDFQWVWPFFHEPLPDASTLKSLRGHVCEYVLHFSRMETCGKCVKPFAPEEGCHFIIKSNGDAEHVFFCDACRDATTTGDTIAS